MGDILAYPVPGTNMKLVAILIGVSTELAALSLLAWAGVSMHHGHVHKELEDAMQRTRDSGREQLLHDALESNGFWRAMRVVKAIYACCATVNAAQCVFSACLMLAVHTGRAQVVRAWVVFSAFWLLSNALLVPPLALMGVLLAAHIAGAVVLIIMVFAMPAMVYCLLIVRRYYKELVECQQENSDFHSHVRLTVNG